jgi:excisionase family DNA binding protein
LLSRLLDVSEVAEILGQHPVTVYSEIRDGVIPAVRLGTRSIRVREEDLKQYLEARSTAKVGDAS